RNQKEGLVSSVIDFGKNDWPAEQARQIVDAGVFLSRPEFCPGAVDQCPGKVALLGYSMELVRPTFKGHVHDSSTGVAVLCGEGCCQHFDFFHGVLDRFRLACCSDHAGSRSHGGDTVIGHDETARPTSSRVSVARL